jgi:hypothetical protein
VADQHERDRHRADAIQRGDSRVSAGASARVSLWPNGLRRNAISALGGDAGTVHRKSLSAAHTFAALARGQGVARAEFGYFGNAMYLVSRYSSMPSKPPSRPKPDSLTPPNGAAGSEITPRFTPTIPDSIDSDTRRARSSDFV